MGAVLLFSSAVLYLAASLVAGESTSLDGATHDTLLQHYMDDDLVDFCLGVEQQLESEALSEKEWSAVINTMSDGRQPDYLLEEYLVLQQNQTGSSNSTSASQNFYNNKVFGTIERDGNKGNYTSISVHYTTMKRPYSRMERNLAVGTVSRLQFVQEGNSTVNWQGSIRSSNFIRVPKGSFGSYVYYGHVSEIVNGTARRDNGTVSISIDTFTVTNTTSNPMKSASSANYNLIPAEDNFTHVVGTQEITLTAVGINTYFILKGSMPKHGEGEYSVSLSGETNSMDSRKLADLSVHLDGYTSYEASHPFGDESLPAIFNGVSLGL